jgi:cell division protein FtsQ
MSKAAAVQTKSATIKRNAKRPKVKAKSRRAPTRRSRFFDRILTVVPIRTETIERAITVCTVLLIGVAITSAAVFAGVPTFVGTQIAQAAGRAGFKVEHVEVAGQHRMESLNLYAIALKDYSMAMPLVDLERIRNELMQYSWIEDARVSRRLPDTLVVDIVERTPAAIWQNNQKLALIDAKGVVLERVDPKAMPDLPLVIGESANDQVADLTGLLDRVPAIKSVLSGATWVGNRRWDLRFKSGEVLALPEGTDIAEVMLKKFMKIDSTERLLGRGFVRFDMRDPDKFVVRLPQGAPAKDDVKPEQKGGAVNGATAG